MEHGWYDPLRGTKDILKDKFIRYLGEKGVDISPEDISIAAADGENNKYNRIIFRPEIDKEIFANMSLGLYLVVTKGASRSKTVEPEEVYFHHGSNAIKTNLPLKSLASVDMKEWHQASYGIEKIPSKKMSVKKFNKKYGRNIIVEDKEADLSPRL